MTDTEYEEIEEPPVSTGGDHVICNETGVGAELKLAITPGTVGSLKVEEGD